MNLNLNGNQLTGIVTNGQKLKQGEDFVLNGEELVLKSSLLTKLTTVGNLGVNAVLSVQFNNGPDWKLKLTVNDKPVLHNAEGTTEAFAIPTNFNGNRVATMEATYAAGGNAGPQDWTSFKEYDNTFSPSFMTDEIKLLPDFFKDVKDGEVILKFHFWSGEIVTYTITKRGDNIVGKTS